MSSSLAADLESSRNLTCRNINHWPDVLLIRILSFLPTKEAVATSLLSRRWLSLWTKVPVLDFQEPESESEDSLSCELIPFSKFVSGSLNLHGVASLDKFRLKCHKHEGSSLLNTWIQHAISREVVREIDISISVGKHRSFYKLPSRFFTNMNLKVLKLSHGILIDVPNDMSVCFPSLKVLHLMWVEYANNESVSNLFRGCTVLEELVIDRFSEYYVSKFIISIHTLKSLSYIVHQEENWFDLAKRGHELKIDAPNLKYLQLVNVGSFVHFESVFTSLNKANIDFNGIGLFQVAKTLCNAQFLSLEWITCGNIMASLKEDCFPWFHNLTQLKLQIDAGDCDVIPLFLENSPNLEVLFVNKINVRSSSTRERGCVLKSLSPHLRQVYDGGFQGHVDEIEMVEFILKKSSALELFEICCYGTSKELKYRILKRLSMFPRASESCQLIFEPEIHLRKNCLLNSNKDLSMVNRRRKQLNKFL